MRSTNRGRSLKLLTLATLYAASKATKNIIHNINDICTKTEISRKDLGKAYKFIKKNIKTETKTEMALAMPSDCITKYVSKLN